MTDTMKLALTTEQWAGLQGSHGIPVEISAVLAVENDEWHEGMALCNAVLPDDDEGKLVRADVRAVLAGASMIESAYERNATSTALYAIAAKLASLLPPEAT